MPLSRTGPAIPGASRLPGLLRVLRLWLLLLALPYGAPPAAALPGPVPMVAGAPRALPPAAPAAEERRCTQGRETVELAWRIIDYGKATLKYGVGLLLLMLGALLLGLGGVLSLLDRLVC